MRSSVIGILAAFAFAIATLLNLLCVILIGSIDLASNAPLRIGFAVRVCLAIGILGVVIAAILHLWQRRAGGLKGRSASRIEPANEQERLTGVTNDPQFREAADI